MADKITARFPGRHLVILGVVGLVTTGLLWRAVDLQLTHQEFLQTQGDARYLRVVTNPAHRGMILDRREEPLAVSTPVESVWVNPQELKPKEQGWLALSRLLDLDPGYLGRVIARRTERKFVYLRRHADPHIAARVAELGLAGVYRQREYRRYYPLGEVAAHVAGFTNVDDVGQEGMELSFDDLLRGRDGSKRVIRDRLGRIVEDVENIRTPRAGRNLVMSIDGRLQYLAYRALLSAVKRHRARSGSAVVVDVRTGEVLAMVNQPSYNPNNRPDRVGACFRNRAVTDVFEPGSTIKPFIIAAALETSRFKPDTLVDTTPGLFKVGRYTVRDLRNYGPIDVATVITKSSNVGASKIALSISPERLWQTLASVGFGETSGSGFPGESAGTLSHFSEWGDIHRATLSFGYGLSVTPLQLARAYTVIATGGLRQPVTFERVEKPGEARRVMSKDVAFQVRRMLESVVAEGGTGERAHISGFRVAGKTGTVRKSTVGGYADDRYMAVFAGIVPASAPRLVMVVVIDEPRGKEYYGGQVAAPVFAEVMSGALRLLGVSPDDHVVVPRRIAHANKRPTFDGVLAQAHALGEVRAIEYFKNEME